MVGMEQKQEKVYGNKKYRERIESNNKRVEEELRC